ncbi:MAG: 50S ribosomal protein L17 [Deltaproteobacteria bacterium]|nr:50S ribosomal protein L17 [Deltaproteobacteria bacterium]
MRHRKTGRKLGRNSSHRNAMFRNMVTSLFKYEQLETTDSKAKELRPIAEKMITLSKRGDLHARRQALSYIKDGDVTHRLFEDLKDRYSDRQGGYLRIVKKGSRRGDGAPVSVVQLLPAEQEKKTKKKVKGAKSAIRTESKKKEVKKTSEKKGSVEDKDPEKRASAKDSESGEE